MHVKYTYWGVFYLNAVLKYAMQNTSDSLSPFLFENTPIRGNTVQLSATFSQSLQYHNYPLMLRIMIGELMAASALLSATLKMEGALILQIQGKGALKLLVVECSSNLEMRATATWDGGVESGFFDNVKDTDFKALIGDGHCMITLNPSEGEAYHGIVPIEGDNIAAMLENYMLRSQQIDTKLYLECDGKTAAGMLLQKLPNQLEIDIDAWNRMTTLANTVTADELISLPAETLLMRLFAEEDVRLFEARSTRFKCSCKREGVANMLRMLGKSEVDSVLAEQGKVEVNCDFCNKHYAFDAVDVAALFVSDPVIKTSNAQH